MMDILKQINENRLPNVSVTETEQLEKVMLKHAKSALDSSGLYSMIAFQMGWDNKVSPLSLPMRTIGQIVISIANSAGSDGCTIIKAAAMELLYNFLMTHKDVQESNTENDGRASLCWEWGPAQAINTGDALHALARLALIRGMTDADIPVADSLRAFDSLTLRICEGLYEEIEYQEKLLITAEEYLKTVRKIQGSLIACALVLGHSSNDGLIAKSLIEYGELIGVAQAINRDIVGMWGDANQKVKGQLIIKKKLLPVIYAFNADDIATKRALGEIYAQRVINPDKLPQISQILENSGAREYCEAQLKEHILRANNKLAEANISTESSVNIQKLADKIVKTDLIL